MAKKAVLMIHGALFGFEPAFLGLSLYAEPPQVSFPVFLAQRGVDVWGISFRWAQVPIGFPDQAFMADWGMDVSVSDAKVALRIARTARWLGGQGSRRLHVLGYSFGAWTAMALANAEATMPRRERDIAGLIPVEGTFKADPANTTFVEPWCNDAATFQEELDGGQFGFDRSFLAYFNQLALDFPDEPSPFMPGFTNAQAKVARATWPQGLPGQEWFHTLAGTFDESGMPTGLVYTDFALSCQVVTNVYGYDPIRYAMDVNAITCDGPDVPWDDHLAEVRVPILFMGAGGAFGPLMEYQARLVGSGDVTTRIVREQPPELAWLDAGHNDIFWSPAMRDLFWKPILSWIWAH
jgi:pimeloyl-ACP methyl ester carboxylesterase